MYFIKSAFLVSALLLASYSFAQTDQVSQVNQSETAKVGYFDLVRVMNSIPQAKEAEKRLEIEFASRKARLEQQDASIKEDKSAFERDQSIMSDADKDKTRRDLRNRSRELKLSIQEYQEDLSLRQNQETAALQQLVRQAVLQVAKEDGFDLIIDQGAVLFASDRVNITKKVMQSLSKQEK